MNKLKNLFGEWPMGWPKVIILAVFAAVLTAVLNIIPALRDTSFQDIAINLDVWILLAMLIIMNCKTRQEAVLKTLVFFLVSQPLIYLIEVPFSAMGFGIFQYYKYWFIITLLTIPGAAIAFQVKKKGWLGTAALSVAVGYLGYMAVVYFRTMMVRPPHHLLSMVFCIALAVMMILLFIDERMQRLAAGAVLLVAIAVSLYVTRPVVNYEITLPQADWTYEIENEAIASVQDNGSGSYIIEAGDEGTTLITFTNSKGDRREYYATISGGSIFVNEFTE